MGTILDIVTKTIGKNISKQSCTEVDYESVIDENNNDVYEQMEKKAPVYNENEQYVQDLNKFLSELDPMVEHKVEKVSSPAEQVVPPEPKKEENKDQTKSLKDQRDEVLISMYSEKIKKLQKEIDEQYEMFLRFPSSYAHFHNEWKMFYLEKSFEVFSQGHNNYIPAWIIHWSQRVEKMKEKDWSQHQSSLKRKLNMDEKREIFSDISDDEPEYESPTKRLKQESFDPKDFHPLHPVESYTEVDRMMIAYNIAMDCFKKEKHLSPEKLIEIMKMYEIQNREKFEGKKVEVDFTEDDLTVANQNFE